MFPAIKSNFLPDKDRQYEQAEVVYTLEANSYQLRLTSSDLIAYQSSCIELLSSNDVSIG